MNIKELVKEYRDLSAEKARLKVDFARMNEPIDKRLAEITGELLEVMGSTGVDSFKTEEGTAYKTTRTSVSCVDKGAFMDYIKEHDAWPLLEVRPSKSGVEEFMDGQGLLPPGIDLKKFITVNVRKTP